MRVAWVEEGALCVHSIAQKIQAPVAGRKRASAYACAAASRVQCVQPQAARVHPQKQRTTHAPPLQCAFWSNARSTESIKSHAPPEHVGLVHSMNLHCKGVF